MYNWSSVRIGELHGYSVEMLLKTTSVFSSTRLQQHDSAVMAEILTLEKNNSKYMRNTSCE